MSLLSVCTNAANDAGVNVPATIIGNADPAAARLLQMARRTARDMAERANWTALTVENVFIANGTSDYMLPADFRLVGYAGQKIQNRLCLELRRKRTSCARHGKVSLGGPVLTSILVQGLGRTASKYSIKSAFG